MSNVRNTVVEAMRASGLGSETRRAEPVITALERQQAEMVQRARQVMGELSVDEGTQTRILVQIGLVEEQPQQASGGGDSDLAQSVARLTQSVERLEQVARSRGLI